MSSFYKKNRPLVLMALILFMLSMTTGCTEGENADALALANTYIQGFQSFMTAGDDYANQGLEIQADYAYRWSLASVASMRYCVDSLLYIKGEGDTLEGLVGNQLSDWDVIAAINYASPYPWFFEGIVYHAQGKEDAALLCYENALTNPHFSLDQSKGLMSLEAMNVATLKAIRTQLEAIEIDLSKKVAPQDSSLPRQVNSFDDGYLRACARAALNEEEPNYVLALQYYEGALGVNPYEGDNFLGCALMCLELKEADRMYFYVNEGLYVDPDHEGLQVLAKALNEEVLP